MRGRLRRHDADGDEPRIEALDRGADRGGGEIWPEIVIAPSIVGRDDPRHHDAELVPLPGKGGEHDVPLPPLSAQRLKHEIEYAPQRVRGGAFLRLTQPSPTPLVADPSAQRRRNLLEKRQWTALEHESHQRLLESIRIERDDRAATRRELSSEG